MIFAYELKIQTPIPHRKFNQNSISNYGTECLMSRWIN